MSAARGPDGQPAGIVTRSMCALIDLVTVLAMLGLLYLGLVLVRLLYSPRTFRFPQPEVWLSTTSTVALSIVYLTVLWAVSGRTVGAAALGLRTVTARGRRLPWPRALLRAVTCVVFPFGLAWVAVDARRRSLHDIVLHTRVVYDWHAHLGTAEEGREAARE